MAKGLGGKAPVKTGGSIKPAPGKKGLMGGKKMVPKAPGKSSGC